MDLEKVIRVILCKCSDRVFYNCSNISRYFSMTSTMQEFHRPYQKSVKLTEIGRARGKNKVSEKKVVTSLPIKKGLIHVHCHHFQRELIMTWLQSYTFSILNYVGKLPNVTRQIWTVFCCYLTACKYSCFNFFILIFFSGLNYRPVQQTSARSTQNSERKGKKTQ